jgi:hypothetical protein
MAFKAGAIRSDPNWIRTIFCTENRAKAAAPSGCCNKRRWYPEKLSRSRWNMPRSAPRNGVASPMIVKPNQAKSQYPRPRGRGPIPSPVVGTSGMTDFGERSLTTSTPTAGANIINVKKMRAVGVRNPRPLSQSGKAMDKPKPKVTTQKRQTALVSIDFECAISRLIAEGSGTVPSGWSFIRQAGALQKPAKRDNPDSMIDYSFPGQDDIENSLLVLPRADNTLQAAQV